MKTVKKIEADLIIFDLDGTLIDSSEDIAWSANMTLKAFGYKELQIEEIKGSVGWGVKALLEKLMPGEPPERIMEARDKFLDFYGAHLVVKTYVYPGVEETLRHFKGMKKKMAVVTNKPAGLAGMILKDLGLGGFFISVIGGDSLLNRKPHPEPIENVLGFSGVAPEKAVLVGDSPIDCETGKGARIGTIGVTYGFRSRQELEDAGCDMLINNFSELKNILG